MYENTNVTNGKREYKIVPEGRYKAQIRKSERGTSKAGRPQLTQWYKIVGGEYDGCMLFNHQSTATEIGENIARELEEIAAKAGKAPVTVLYSKKTSKTNPDLVFDSYRLYYDD